MNLKIGEIVQINTFINKQSFTLLSSGFTNKNVMVSPTPSPDQAEKARNGFFMVLPSANFEMHDEIVKNQVQEEELAGYQSRLDTEKKLFEANIQNSKDQPVKFGSELVFKHIDSGSYLSGCFECSQGGTGKFKVVLSEALNSMIVFRLESYQSFLKDGDKVNLEAPLYIYNQITKCYLDMEENKAVSFSEKTILWQFKNVKELPLVYLQHTRIPGYLCCDGDRIKYLEPKEGYKIYDPIWVDYGDKIGRQNKMMPVKSRIRTFVDINIDLNGVINETEEYKEWEIEVRSSLQDCFELIPIDKLTYKEILFILSTIGALKEFMANLRQNLNYNKLIRLRELIEQVINFIKGITKQNKNEEFFIIPRRQFLMRDLGSLKQMFELIMGIEPYTKEGTLSKIENELVKRVFTLLYQCLVICCLDNERIKSYFEPQLKQIYLHCVNTHIENVLPKLISPTKPPELNVEEFESSNILYLNFLSLLSLNTLNHNQIYNKLKSTKWTISQQIDLNGQKWRYSEKGDYNYLTQWIEMCSKICENRNLRAQTLVMKHVELSNLLSLIRHPFTAQSQIFKKLIDLLHYCYVDTIDLNPVVLDELCQYNNLQKPVKSKKSLIAEESSKIIAQYVDSFQFTPKSMMQNENLLSVLRFLETTLLLGFWEFDTKFNKVIDKLVDILKIHDQELMFSQKKENLLVINVKYTILKIINNIINFRLDEVTKKLTLKFKMLHQSDERVTHENWRKVIEDSMETYEDPGPQIELCKTLIELCQYPNVEFLSTNLSTVKRLFSFRNEILHIFESQYLLDPSENLSGFTIADIKQIRSRLFILKEPTLKYASLKNQSEYGTLLWSPNPKNKGLIQYIWELGSWMKQRTEDTPLQYQRLAEDELYMFFNEREQNIKLHQQILKSMKLPALMMEFLVNQEEMPDGQVGLKLMYIIYYFLTLLVWNSLECKNEVVKYLPTIKRQLFYKIGAPYLLRELFDNNPGLIYNQTEFQQTITMILDHISKQAQPIYHTSKLLDVFRCTLYYNEKAVPQNQIFILSKLQQYQLIVLTVHDVSMKSMVNEFDISYQRALTSGEIEISPKSTFVVTIFNLFGILVEDNNMINIGKCRQIHPFRELVKFSSLSKRFWMLKRNLRAYMNKLYYAGQDYNGLLELVKLEDLENIVFDLNNLIFMSLQKQRIEGIRIKNPVRFEYLYTYVYLNFEEILISFYHMFNNSQMKLYILKSLKKDFELGNFQIHYRLMRIIERLSYIKIKIYFQSRFLRYLINNAINNIQSFLLSEPAILTKVCSAKMKSHLQGSSAENIIGQLKRGDILSYFIHHSDSVDDNDVLSLFDFTSGRIIRRASFPLCSAESPKVHDELLALFKGLFFTKKNEARKVKFDEYVKQFHQQTREHGELNNQLELKFNIKYPCGKGCKAGCQSCEWFFFDSTNCRINFEEYVKVLLKENCLNPLHFPKELKVFLFKMIAEYVKSKKEEKKATTEKGVRHFWKEESEEEHTSAFTTVQLYLKDCNFQNLVCSTIQKCRLESDLELINSLFVASIQFLSEGNTECQNALLNQIRKDEDNLFMRKINELIVYVTKKIVEDNEVKKPEPLLNPDFYLCYSDTYDYYDATELRVVRKNVFEPDTMKEINEKKLIVSVFSNLFDFLHELCQNNNVEAKNLIKFQGNPRNTVNLLETAVVSLRKMVKVLNPKIITMPPRLLGFINQTTQLPCIDNQIFMAKSTLFEDMSKMEENLSSLFMRGKQPPVDSDEEPPDESFLVEIQDIYHQFINVLISISEGNCQSIYNEFRKIPPIFFIRVSYNYLKQMGLESLKEPLDIFNISREDPITVEFEKLVADPTKHDTVEKLLQLQILSKELEYTDEFLCRDYVKFFKSPFFSVLPRLIQIEIEGQPQFFCPAGQITEETKNQLIQQAPRTTQREKIIYLLQSQYQVFNQLEYEKDPNLDNYKLASQIVAIIINIFITFKNIDIYEDGVEMLANTSWILFILKIVHYLLILLYVVKIVISQKAYLFDQYSANENKPIPNNIILRTLLLMKLVFRSSKFTEIMFNLLFSLVAFYFPTLYSVHVFVMFSRIQSLNSVFDAIQINIKPLSIVGVFGIVFFYIFSLVSLDFYSETLYTDKSQQVCTNWLDCILDLYISGTVNSSTVRFVPSRFLLDLVYFIFFGLLFGNIISGLMTDTFKQLRSQKDEIEFDENNYCYICGINRETLQRNGQILNQSFRTAANKGLKIHEDRHDRFNYLYYIYMLKTKDESDYTGLEYKIMNKLRTEDISWMPSFERETAKSSESEGEIQRETKRILEMIDKLQKKRV